MTRQTTGDRGMSSGLVHPVPFTRTVAGVWALTWRSMVAWRRAPSLVGLLFAGPLLAYLSTRVIGEGALLEWMMNVHLKLLVPLYCLVVCGSMIRDEVQGETLGFLITRPVTRGRLFLAKYISHWLWLQATLGINAALLVFVGIIQDVPEIGSVGAMLFGGQVLAVSVYGGLGALFGLLSKRYLVLGVVYGFFVEFGIGQIPTNINSLSMVRHLRTLMAQCPSVQEEFAWSPEGMWFSVAMMVLTTVLTLAVGAGVFTFKEYLTGDDMGR